MNRPGIGLLVPFILMTSREGAAQIAPPGTSSFGLQDRSSGLGLSREYNPAIGANLLMGGEYLSRDASGLNWPHPVVHSAGETGLLFQEAEVGLAAAVDPYLRADLTIALHFHDGEFHTHVEEGYVTTLFLPRVTLRGGKFYMPFGRHNALHAHAFPFVDAPLTHAMFFGHEGLNEAAVEAALLVPLPWFVEVSAWAANGDNEVLFHAPKGRDLAYGGRLHTLIELGESVTTEVGGSYAGGRNAAGGWTHVFGGDWTLRWRPASRERYHQLIWQTEYIAMRRTGPRPSAAAQESGGEGQASDAHAEDLAALLETQAEVASGLGGLYSFVAAQVAQRWWLQARFDAIGYPLGDAQKRLHRASGLIAFVPTEFSAIRLQYSYFHEGRVHQVLFQVNVTMGAHPAHAY